MSTAPYKAPLYSASSWEPAPIRQETVDSKEATRRTAEAVKRALGDRGMTPSEAARRLGYSQPALSNWVNGKSRPGNEDLQRLEDVLGYPHGYILKLAGFVADVTTIEEAVAMADELDDAGRSTVLGTYHGVTGRYRGVDGTADPV